jgi:hypothetical protein
VCGPHLVRELAGSTLINVPTLGSVQGGIRQGIACPAADLRQRF